MYGIFNDCFPPVMDGVSVATRNYAYWLHQKGEQVCVVTPSADQYEDQEPFPVLRYCSIPLIFRNPYRMGLPQFDRHIRKALNEMPFSLVHAHCPFSSGKLALQQARMRHIPMVATFHSKYRADFERCMPIKAVVDYLIRDVVDFYNQADEVWIPQASVEETLREYGYRGKIEVVDNGNDFAGTYSDEEREQVRQQLGLKADEPLLLFVGQHIYEKNLEFLLRSVALLKDMPFRMFFIGTGYAASALQDLARRLCFPLLSFDAAELAAVSTPHPSTAAGERFACAPFSVCEAACLLAARRMAATGMMKADGGGASPVSRSALKDGPPAGTGNGQQTDGTDVPAARLLVEKTKVAGQLTLAVALSNSILRRDDV